MAKFGLLVGWGGPVRGREVQAAAVFEEAVRLWRRLQRQGVIEAWEPVLLEPHGGDLGGFFLLRGKRGRLAELRASDELIQLGRRAEQVFEGYGVVGAELDGRIDRAMRELTRAARELGAPGGGFSADSHR
jgi:hypothetical protein